MKVNFVDLPGQYRGIKQLVLKDIEEALDTGSFMGCEVFERKFADYHGRKYCVGVGSGTDALWLTLLALGIGPGDEVIVPANTYIATAFAVSHTGAKPIFVDPDPDTYTMSSRNLEDAVSKRTKAIMPVHLYGCPADMKGVMAFAAGYNLFVVEDCAQSIGAIYHNQRTGNFGNAGCYSFYPAKNLGGLGQGGAVVTDDVNLVTKLRELGNVGRSSNSWFDYVHIGFNSRLDAVNAKFLERCLDKIDSWNNRRREVASWYDSNLKNVAQVKTPKSVDDKVSPVYHLYELRVANKEVRDGLKTHLENSGVATGLHYPIPCQRQPVYEDLYRYCPLSDSLSNTLLSLPMHPKLKRGEVDYVCEKIKEFMEK